MANVIKRSEGLRIDYTPSGDVAAGAVVVVQKIVGVATTAIAADALGTLDVEGVFEFPKATGSGAGIDLGKTVYWHASSTNQVNETSESGTKIGYVIKAASDTDETVLVKLTPAA